MPAKRVITKKVGPSQGRPFWMCAAPKNDKRCSFFAWAGPPVSLMKRQARTLSLLSSPQLPEEILYLISSFIPDRLLFFVNSVFCGQDEMILFEFTLDPRDISFRPFHGGDLSGVTIQIHDGQFLLNPLDFEASHHWKNTPRPIERHQNILLELHIITHFGDPYLDLELEDLDAEEEEAESTASAGLGTLTINAHPKTFRINHHVHYSTNIIMIASSNQRIHRLLTNNCLSALGPMAYEAQDSL